MKTSNLSTSETFGKISTLTVGIHISSIQRYTHVLYSDIGTCMCFALCQLDKRKKKMQSAALRYPRLSYTAKYINPWLTFNSCPITAIVNILSSTTMTLASFSFSLPVHVAEKPKRSASGHICPAYLEHSYPLA